MILPGNMDTVTKRFGEDFGWPVSRLLRVRDGFLRWELFSPGREGNALYYAQKYLAAGYQVSLVRIRPKA